MGQERLIRLFWDDFEIVALMGEEFHGVKRTWCIAWPGSARRIRMLVSTRQFIRRDRRRCSRGCHPCC
jgi:hypothetical protein